MTETNAFNNDEKSKRSRRHSSSSTISSGSKSGRRQRAHKRCSISAFIGQLFFNFISKIIRLVFQLIYGVKGETMPAITDPILLESATSLARKIRKQEVSCLNSYAYANVCTFVYTYYSQRFNKRLCPFHCQKLTASFFFNGDCRLSINRLQHLSS